MRKGQAKKRHISPDPKYMDTLVARFVNCLMKEGKKSLAYGIFYKAVEKVEEKTNEDGLGVWKQALGNVTPAIEVKRRRVGGATLQVPTEVRSDRKISLSIKWLINCARARSEKTMVDRLTSEIIAASKGEGNAIKKRNETQKMAESNRAFSHIRIK